MEDVDHTLITSWTGVGLNNHVNPHSLKSKSERYVVTLKIDISVYLGTVLS